MSAVHKVRVLSVITILLAMSAPPVAFGQVDDGTAAQGSEVIIVAADGSGGETSLAAAVDRAPDGASIQVRPGRYEGPIEISRPISITGDGPIEEIVIVPGPRRGQDEFEAFGPGATLAIHGVDARLSGVTVKGGPSVFVNGGAASIERIAADEILIRAAGGVELRDSDIRGGVHVTGGSVDVSGSRIGTIGLEAVTDSTVQDNEVGSIYVDGSGIALRGNTLGDEPRRGQESRITVSPFASATTLSDNSVDGGTVGILIRGPGHTELVGNHIAGTRAGLVVGNPNVILEGNTVCDNRRDLVVLPGIDVDLDANDICDVGAPRPSFDPGLTADADGMLFEPVEPGVRRLLDDGAGHYPSEPWVVNPRDMDQVSIDDEGRVHVWTTTRGIDNELAGDLQHWVLGIEGAEFPGGFPRDRRGDEDQAAWEAAIGLAQGPGEGTMSIGRRLGEGSDGTLWAIARTDAGRLPARFDGDRWTVFADATGSLARRIGPGQVSADGRLWFTGGGNGLLSFDGNALRRYLAATPLNGFAIAPDGRIWVLSQQEDRGIGGVYVIDPAAIPDEAEIVLDDPELVALFPRSLGDRPLEVHSLTGSGWLGQLDGGDRQDRRRRSAVEGYAASGGKTVDDLSIAYALHEPSPGNHAAVTAVRLRGVDAATMSEQVVSLMLGDIERAEMQPVEIAGRAVIRVSDAGTPGLYPRFLYASGDVVWIIEAEEPLRSEIVAALP